MPISNAFGKKVFFLYPPPVLVEVAELLAKNEYEVYLVYDHRRLRKALSATGESILFINIDQTPDGMTWEGYVRDLHCDGACKDVGVGIVTLSDIDPAIREKYILELQVPCGFVVLKLGTAKTIEILLKTLEANEARGKRKYVRAICPPDSGRCNVEHEGRMIYGDIADISSAGMAVAFHEQMRMRPGTVLRKLSILVKGVRLLVDGFVASEKRSESGMQVLIIMFIPNSLDEPRLEKLKLLVYRLNQYSMDQSLSQMPSPALAR
jgi:hypothetical protein